MLSLGTPTGNKLSFLKNGDISLVSSSYDLRIAPLALYSVLLGYHKPQFQHKLYIIKFYKCHLVQKAPLFLITQKRRNVAYR